MSLWQALFPFGAARRLFHPSQHVPSRKYDGGEEGAGGHVHDCRRISALRRRIWQCAHAVSVVTILTAFSDPRTRDATLHRPRCIHAHCDRQARQRSEDARLSALEKLGQDVGMAGDRRCTDGCEECGQNIRGADDGGSHVRCKWRWQPGQALRGGGGVATCVHKTLLLHWCEMIHPRGRSVRYCFFNPGRCG